MQSGGTRRIHHCEISAALLYRRLWKEVKVKKVLLASSVVALFFASARGANVNLSGTVTHVSGSPIEAATVRVLGEGLETQTDASGHYAIQQLATTLRGTGGFDRTMASIRGDRVELSLAVPAGVSVSAFDTRGRLAVDATWRTLPAGRHVLPIRSARGSSGLSFVRVKVGVETHIFRCISLHHATGGYSEALPYSELLRKRAAAVDTLRISKSGYVTKSVPLEQYSGTVDVELGGADGDGKGGTLVYCFEPKASWIDGVPLANRSGATVWQTSYWTSGALAGASHVISAADAYGDTINDWNRAPTGEPALETYSRQGQNRGGLAGLIKLWQTNQGNPRHVRVVMEIRLAAPTDPTTYKLQGYAPSSSNYTKWSDAVNYGGKFFLGLIAGDAGRASCVTNWWGNPSTIKPGVLFRIGWGHKYDPITGAMAADDISGRHIGVYDINYDRPTTCEYQTYDSQYGHELDVASLTGEWLRVELEQKIATPASVPANACAGCGRPSPTGDGFEKVYITRDLNGEHGSVIPRIMFGENLGTVTFPLTNDYHKLLNFTQIMPLLWFGGNTTPETLAQKSVYSWIRKIEVYEYTEDNL